MYVPNSTQVPNVLLDDYLGDLKPAELKMLLVVIRQTIGWVEDKKTKRRKEKDWISGSQLREKTGYSRRAISKAVDSLSKDGWVEVYDSEEQLLDTPEKRKGKMRLYYRFKTKPAKPKKNKKRNKDAQKGNKSNRGEQKGNNTCAEREQEHAQKVLITKTKQTKTKQTKTCEQKFTWAKFLKTLHESRQRHLNVIAYYFEKKGLSFDTEEKANVAVKRYLRPAAQVQHFSDEEISKTVNHLLETFPPFTIETIYKHLTK
ncbi:HTH domain-containing protein [bacterium AH-315-M05]|nr:HTH domain-containing protein [bacterium AH-315-M05]